MGYLSTPNALFLVILLGMGLSLILSILCSRTFLRAVTVRVTLLITLGCKQFAAHRFLLRLRFIPLPLFLGYLLSRCVHFVHVRGRSCPNLLSWTARCGSPLVAHFCGFRVALPHIRACVCALLWITQAYGNCAFPLWACFHWHRRDHCEYDVQHQRLCNCRLSHHDGSMACLLYQLELCWILISCSLQGDAPNRDCFCWRGEHVQPCAPQFLCLFYPSPSPETNRCAV